LLNDEHYRNPRARDFFLDVFKFVSEQCAFGQFDISLAALRSGANLMAGFAVYPDYPTLLRRQHNDHIHPARRSTRRSAAILLRDSNSVEQGCEIVAAPMTNTVDEEGRSALDAALNPALQICNHSG
jgi:hypothetical protein